MNKILSSIWNYIKSISMRDIIYIIIIFILAGIGIGAIKQCSKVKHEADTNIIAIKDTIHYYHTDEGDLVAFKQGFIAEFSDLKKLNEDLYNEIKKLKMKSDVVNTVYIDGRIEHEVHDTSYVVSHDTIYKGFIKDFNFDNPPYRYLSGNVNYINDTIGINILKDIVNFDYTVAMDDQNRIYVKSSNPYVKYNEITGFSIPREKKKHWSLGPSISVGYDPINKTLSPTIGVSLNYGLLQW